MVITLDIYQVTSSTTIGGEAFVAGEGAGIANIKPVYADTFDNSYTVDFTITNAPSPKAGSVLTDSSIVTDEGSYSLSLFHDNASEIRNIKVTYVRIARKGTITNVPYNIISLILKTERYNAIITPVKTAIGTLIDVTNKIKEKSLISLYI